MKKIALFGGTFDPIHYGHLRSVWEVKETFNLDKIFLIPAAIPPHKDLKNVEDSRDRLEMIRLAISGHPEFSVSDIELIRTGPSYTIDTIRHFKSVGDKDSELFFIIGSDAFLEFNTWKSYAELLKLVPFIVMVRPDSSTRNTLGKNKKIHDFLTSKIPEPYIAESNNTRYTHPGRPAVFIHHVTPLGISSTNIRNMIQHGKSVRFLVPEAVEEYIRTKGLYK